ncbi:MutH/Sau3AI family endonuclease [Exiguobacterium acetylicum]|uniref:MutH/Sau3AI family endonuclease n=1 Tax=Exiguobacterium acetylicum TaxID=41170 RepID=UPI0027DF175F|nr:MutH/Sau3AI family endonuclease [Exiguobacterium acetylicum]MDQ6468771.1 MutH/Sau3AI family endonuclease [Exiguobacterium acetylicum]
MQRIEFERTTLEELLNNARGKTLGEIDTADVFRRTEIAKKITGIAGDVIEQSLLGFPSNPSRDPDIIVDGVEVELKTTGLRRPKRRTDVHYEAKEPLTITAVSPATITDETFRDSHFWRKVEHLLLVYYEYVSPTAVPASAYRDFPLVGYDFHHFDEEEVETLQADWEIIRDYIRQLKDTHDNPEEYYPSLSSALRQRLMFLDTSPKWPHKPRFRIKRAVLTNIVNKSMGRRYESIPRSITTMAEFNDELRRLTRAYKGRTVRQLMTDLGLTGSSGSKSLTESIVVRMFGAKGRRVGKVDLFSKLNVVVKSTRLTEEGANVEDTKLFPVDLVQTGEETCFEESAIHAEMSEIHFLFAIFETQVGGDRLDDVFVGFKHLMLSDDLFEVELRRTWQEVHDLMAEGRLCVTTELDKNGMVRYTKRTNVPRTRTNLPKSRHYTFFLRGSGRDAKDKVLSIDGLSLYRQDLWIKGTMLSRLLNDESFV